MILPLKLRGLSPSEVQGFGLRSHSWEGHPLSPRGTLGYVERMSLLEGKGQAVIRPCCLGVEVHVLSSQRQNQG